MLDEEKKKLQRQFADKKAMLEKRVKLENEERLKEITDRMKIEFSHAQRLQEDRHYEQMTQKERDMKLRMDDQQHRVEVEMIDREKLLEDKVQMRINQ